MGGEDHNSVKDECLAMDYFLSTASNDHDMPRTHKPNGFKYVGILWKMY